MKGESISHNQSKILPVKIDFLNNSPSLKQPQLNMKSYSVSKKVVFPQYKMVDKRKKVVEQTLDSDYEDEIFAHKTKKLKDVHM